MNKYLVKIIASLLFAIFYGLLIKYTNKDVVIIVLLIQIYIELLLQRNDEE